MLVFFRESEMERNIYAYLVALPINTNENVFVDLFWLQTLEIAEQCFPNEAWL